MTSDQAELPLLAVPTARHDDPCTSHEAALDASHHCSLNQLKALKLIALCPCTDYDLEEKTGMQKNSIGKRCSDLYKAGLVRPQIYEIDGQIVKRPGPSGSNCIVWEITEMGRRYLSAELT